MMTESKVNVNQSQVETGSKPSNFLSWFKPFSRGIGQWSWLAQRLTGLFLVMYVFIHLGVIGTMLLDTFLGFEIGVLYNSVTSAMSSPLIEADGIFEHVFSIAFLIDVGLLGALIYHGYNGIRVILFDLGIGIRDQKKVFWILFGLGIISWILSVWFILQMPAIVNIGG